MKTKEKPLTIEERVSRELMGRGWQTSLEYPGFVCVVGEENEWNIGTANPMWGMDLVPRDCRDNTTILSFDLAVPSDSDNEILIADAICAKLDLRLDRIPARYIRAFALVQDIAANPADTIWQTDWHSLRGKALTITAGYCYDESR